MTTSRDALRIEQRRLAARRKELDQELEVIDRQINDIRKLLRTFRDPTTGEVRGGNEEFQVRNIYLRPIVNHWLKIGNTITNLSIQSKVSTKTISRIRNGHGEFSSFTTADRLLSAMGVSDLLGCDEVPVELNPQFRVTPSRPPSQFYED
jgi:hypothetical protein